MFNLEKSIKTWKQKFRSNPAFEDGDIAELESHLRDRIAELEKSGVNTEVAFQKASREIGDIDHIGHELHKTTSTRNFYFDEGSGWTAGIFRNYQKVARRNLFKNKLYTSINFLGLSVGITCCLLIYVFVQNELNYDSFYEKGDRIYKVARLIEDKTGIRKVGITSVPFRAALENDFPGIIEKATLLSPSDAVVTVSDEKFRENRFYLADPNFFTVFTYPFIYGDPAESFRNPNSVVLSSDVTEKYFGQENPLGKTITVDGEYEFEVTGVFEQPEGHNSHIEFDIVGNIELFRQAQFYSEWWWNMVHTYVLLEPNANPEDLEAQFPVFMEKYFGEDMAQNNRRIGLTLQPLSDVYFSNDTTFDWQVEHASKTILYLFGIIAMLILIVACVNFINLATARSVNRAKEIGVRKTLGASRSNLMIQFLSEGLIITYAAGIFSFAAAQLLFPWFQEVAGKEMSVSLFSFEVIISAFVFLTFIGLAAGIYPSLFLSSFQPMKALKQKISFGISQIVVRKGLIVFQFAVSSLLIIGTLVVNSQLNFMMYKSLGFNPDQLINISINNGEVRPYLETFQREIEQLGGVEVSSAMSGVPGGFFDNYLFQVGENWDETYTLKTLFTDHNFTEVLDVIIIAGRDFGESYGTDSTQAVIINKEAADMFGWSAEEALGKRFENQYVDSTARQVIGVVENFHIASLHQPIAPLVVSMVPDRRVILVKTRTDKLNQTLSSIEEIWNQFSPLYPLEYSFVDEQFAQLYASEQQQKTIFFAFSVVAVFIACLGLFSLAALNAENRSKEMGIRKVLGASFKDILLLFNKEILVVVVMAFLLAIPLTYFLSEQWLQEFAFRIDQGIVNYLLAGVLILVLAITTVSYQSLKVASLNPVQSLKDQ